ncbi:sigma-70 family RNA polymerase sigma factor [Kordia sp. YSTF-M3]|uniref:RNA polymerase sigma factor n=1 Tax=Kordia aestuariivivens TaxID=2759037 RepID=A0ABR7QAV8_9FLAO|nr:sigma-70 family RNA polymerase sigma factor [Kordia aestuariivivens]MBC8755712.1 sigma-70 family RNA polymerase sigma factor [Kordia aestuariivivens]
MDDIYIQKVLDGNQDAFRFLIKKYKDLSYSYAMSIVKDEFIAQEVLQTSFIKAYTKLNTFKKNSKFSTWLYRIVVNEAFKVLNKRKKDFLVYEENTESNEVGIDDMIFKTDVEYQQYYINEALKKLGAKESLALRLFYLEEHTINEITDITGWNKTNIKVLLHRGRNNMKKILTMHDKNNKQTFGEWMN